MDFEKDIEKKREIDKEGKGQQEKDVDKGNAMNMEKTKTYKGAIVDEDNEEKKTSKKGDKEPRKNMKIRNNGSKWREMAQNYNEEMKAKEESKQKQDTRQPRTKHDKNFLKIEFCRASFKKTSHDQRFLS